MAIVAGAEKVLVASATASAAATIDITTGIDSTYDEYELHFIGLRLSVDGPDVYCRQSSDGLAVPTYIDVAGGSASIGSYTSGEGAKFYQSISGASLWLSHNTASGYKPGNAAGETMSGIVRYYSQTDTSLKRKQFCVAASTSTTGNIILKSHENGINTGGAAVDSIRIYTTSGTITGEVRLYGIVKSL